MASWIRNNILGLVAIFIALSGSAVAVQSARDPAANVAAKKKAKRGPPGPQGPAGTAGAQGPVGPAGQLTGPASGDLTGNYPAPVIASGAVGPSKIGQLPALFLTADSMQTLTTANTFQDVIWDTNRVLRNFTHTPATGSATVQTSGLYAVSALLTEQDATATAASFSVRLTVNGVEVPGSTRGVGQGALAGQTHAVQDAVLVQLNAGDVLAAQFTSTSGGAKLVQFGNGTPSSGSLTATWVGP